MSETQGQNFEPTPDGGANGNESVNEPRVDESSVAETSVDETSVDASAQPSPAAPAADANAAVALPPVPPLPEAAQPAQPAAPAEAPAQPAAPVAAPVAPVAPVAVPAQPVAPAAAPAQPAAPAAAPAAAHVYGTPAYPQPSGPGAPAPAPAPHYGGPQHPGAAYAGTPYQGTPLGAPTAPSAPAGSGAAFGAAAHAQPETGAAGAAPTTTKAAGGGKAGKVVGLLVAAALVGGAAGLGGAAIGNSWWNDGSSSPAAGPSTVTVNNPENMTATTEIAAKVVPSVVTLDVSGASQAGSGSGVILSSDGYVLTNTHVVTLDGAESNPTIRVTTSDGRIYTAKVVGLDPIYDLAVVKLEGASGLTPIEFADSSELNVGDRAIAVGAPLGLSSTVTDGIVSALNRSIEIASSALPDTQAATPGKGTSPSPNPSQTPGDGNGGNGQGGSPWFFDIPGQNTPGANSGKISIAVIQTDAAINPGNSGGALVNGKGQLIGINVAIATAGGGGSSQSGNIGVGFAIPSNVAERISAELIESGTATHGLLGATVQPASVEADATIAGAIIRELTPGGPAEKAGLQPGDVVVEFNRSPITSAIDLTAQVRAAAADSTAKLTYVRNGTSHTVEVTLGQLPG